MEIIVLLIWAGCAAICYSQAKKKNLNVGLWTFLGLFFGVFAVIGVLVASPKS
jgi:glycerol uptake facilitator-like aquaporin